MARRPKYILLEDRSGRSRGGRICECLPESEQPKDPENIALRDTWSYFKLECSKLDVGRLTDSEADLLGVVWSSEERLRIYRDKNRLTEAKTLNIGGKVFVKIRKPNTDLELRGVIRYKGSLPLYCGNMFGVELLDKESEEYGNTDGTYEGERYFICPADRGIFVPVDQLRPRQDQDQGFSPILTSWLSDHAKSNSGRGSGETKEYIRITPLFPRSLVLKCFVRDHSTTISKVGYSLLSQCP